MTKFESEIKHISYSTACVYDKLTNLSNLESIKDRLPADKIQDLSFDANSLSFSISPVGKISLEIIEREPNKTIKFATTQSPMPFNLWVQLVGDSESTCKMKLTIGADVNPFIKGMIQKPLQEGVEKMAEMLSMIKY